MRGEIDMAKVKNKIISEQPEEEIKSDIPNIESEDKAIENTPEKIEEVLVTEEHINDEIADAIDAKSSDAKVEKSVKKSIVDNNKKPQKLADFLF